jgi:hypothetical protein
MPGRRPGLALALLVIGSGPAFAAPKSVEAEGFSLRFDDTLWEQQLAAPPSLLTLRCIATACSPGNVATFVRDERPLLAPGFGAFGPGAVSGAAVDLRIQSLTPASRLLARDPVEPVSIGGTDGYRGVYDIEDRALARTGAIILLLRGHDSTLEARMGAPNLSSADIAAFDALLVGFELQN